METVKMDIANFNLTFGKDQSPMLTYFEEFLFPALQMDYIREKGDNKFSFDSIEIVQTKQGYALTGLISKDTKLIVKSIKDSDGNLVETNEKYPSAPYSYFCIFLRNHRMIFVPNQKGSPDLRSFAATVTVFLNHYRRQQNAIREKKKLEKLPLHKLNVIGIPSKKNIAEALKEVRKVSQMKLRFYPLNGEDFDLDSVASAKIRELVYTREYLDSNTGSLIFNSPQDIENVGTLMSDLGGTVETTLSVDYNGGGKGKIKNQQVSEKLEIEVPSDQVSEETTAIIDKAEELDTIKKVSEENDFIYKSFVSSIKETFIQYFK